MRIYIYSKALNQTSTKWFLLEIEDILYIHNLTEKQKSRLSYIVDQRAAKFNWQIPAWPYFGFSTTILKASLLQKPYFIL